MRIFVRPFQGVVVKYPKAVSTRKILSFVDSRRPWIRLALQRAEDLEKKSKAFFSTAPPPLSEIRESLSTRLQELAESYNFQYNKVSIRNQKSRWGSCSHENNISLNQKLYFLPDGLRDYVLIHELAHTREKNHSPHFWNILYKLLGKSETQQRRRDLKAFDFLFHPPPDNSK